MGEHAVAAAAVAAALVPQLLQPPRLLGSDDALLHVLRLMLLGQAVAAVVVIVREWDVLVVSRPSRLRRGASLQSSSDSPSAVGSPAALSPASHSSGGVCSSSATWRMRSVSLQ